MLLAPNHRRLHPLVPPWGNAMNTTYQPGPSGSLVLPTLASSAHATQHLTLDDPPCCLPTSRAARERLTVPLTFLRLQLAASPKGVGTFPRGSHPPVLSAFPPDSSSILL